MHVPSDKTFQLNFSMYIYQRLIFIIMTAGNNEMMNYNIENRKNIKYNNYIINLPSI